MKKFIITIDTEGDNLWSWHPGDTITTENVRYLNRFQKMAEKYDFKPVWLTNYEMIMDDRYVNFIADVVERNAGELGMHLHAWNSPPLYDLPKEQVGQPYLIEYPTAIMDDKIKTLTQLIESRTGIKPVSHRAGRWATDERYFKLLEKYGYMVDCSVTPHKSWKSYVGQTKDSGGSDYTNFIQSPGYMYDSNILEIPVSIVYSHKLFSKSIKGKIKDATLGRDLWLRPNGVNLDSMKYVLEQIIESNADYVMFMLHSSEMMPGGSATFANEESIELLYHDINTIFELASKNFEGITLKDYQPLLRKKD